MSVANTDLADSWLNLPEQAAAFPARLVKLVTEQAQIIGPVVEDDRRQVPRVAVVSKVAFVCVDESMKALGLPQTALTRDFSTRGAGLVAVEPPASNRMVVVVDLAGGRVALSAEVCRVQEIEPTVYDIGLRFVGRVSAANTTPPASAKATGHATEPEAAAAPRA